MYDVQKIPFLNVCGLYHVGRILYRCGKDMDKKYGLQHWNNSPCKSALIVVLCAMKNQLYLVCDSKDKAIATFQIRKTGHTMWLQKLAVDPDFSGNGVGSYCVEYIERLALQERCVKVKLEVYDKSERAIRFYLGRGYSIYGSENSLKYTLLQMEKRIGETV